MSLWNPDPRTADYHEDQARQARRDRGEDPYNARVTHAPNLPPMPAWSGSYSEQPCPWPGDPERLGKPIVTGRMSTVFDVIRELVARGLDRPSAERWVVEAREEMFRGKAVE